jgi:hypothetical protein
LLLGGWCPKSKGLLEVILDFPGSSEESMNAEDATELSCGRLDSFLDVGELYR